MNDLTYMHFFCILTFYRAILRKSLTCNLIHMNFYRLRKASSQNCIPFLGNFVKPSSFSGSVLDPSNKYRSGTWVIIGTCLSLKHQSGNIRHCSDITWASWFLRSPATQLFAQQFWQITKETPKLCTTGPLWGGFNSQMASHAENTFMSWRYHQSIITWSNITWCCI